MATLLPDTKRKTKPASANCTSSFLATVFIRTTAAVSVKSGSEPLLNQQDGRQATKVSEEKIQEIYQLGRIS